MTCWADHFNTYEEACEYYGCDTPAQLREEARYQEQEYSIIEQDEMEARGGPRAKQVWEFEATDDYIPF